MTGFVVKTAKRLIVLSISVVCGLGMTLAAQSPNAVPVSSGPVITPYNTPAINAPVRLCLASSFGTPCNTAGVTLYSDSNLTQQINNPTATNSQGIYTFYLNASQYTLPQLFLMQVTVTQTVTYSYLVSISAGEAITAIPVPINEGGTGATTAQGAATNIVDGNAINPATVGATTAATWIAANHAVFAAGPYTSVESYAPPGATLCNGSSQPLSEFYTGSSALAEAQAKYPFVTALTQTADYAAWQAALNAWVLTAGTLIGPSSQKCVLGTPLAGVFSVSNNNVSGSLLSNYIIDLRGSTLYFSVPASSADAIGFTINASGNIFIEHFLIENGLIQDTGNAAVALLIDGAGNSNNGYLSDVQTKNLRVVFAGANIGLEGESIFQSRFDNTTVQNSQGSVSGSHCWDFENGPVGSQQAGDITLNDSEAQSCDIGIYSHIQGDLKIIGGTYLQTYEQAIYTNGGSLLSVHAAHLENQYYNNTGASGTLPKISCASFTCDIGGNRAAKDNGSDYATTVDYIYQNASTDKAVLTRNDTTGGNTIQQAVINTNGAGNGSATLTGIATSEVTLQNNASYASNVSLLSGSSGLQTPSASVASLTLNGQLLVSAANDVPLWLQNFGTGAEGSETCNGGTLSGDHNYTSFTVGSSGCTVSNIIGLVVHASSCTITGTLTASTSASSQYTGPVGTGGGGGGGTGAGTAANGNYLYPGTSTISGVVAGGTAGASSAGAGGAGNQPSTTYWNSLLNSGITDGLDWVGGTGGAGAGGAAGGYGSPPLVLICGTFSGSGSIVTTGGAGANATANNAGGGGGGAAGPVVISTTTAGPLSVTITQTGGAGGTCGSYTGCGVGGAGAAGMLAEFLGW